MVNRSTLLGVALGVSMVLTLVIAGFCGTTIPLALDRIGKDPATSASTFITTATDVPGIVIFLGLVQSVLRGAPVPSSAAWSSMSRQLDIVGPPT